jgi:type IX secretion system PorP/SprF family membrane protein
MKTIYKFLIAVVPLFSGVTLMAQDAHLSQYDASPILLNPALTGVIENGTFRIGANYRTQWGSISSASFTSTGMSFDTQFKSRWGIGAYATNNDLSGFINVFNFMLSGSYEITEPNNGKFKITTGLQAGILFKQLDQKEFVFDSQYENGSFIADNPSGEIFNKNNLLLPDFNWGISYIHTDNNWKIRPFAGVSVFHLSLPKESFTDGEKDNLPIKWVFNGGAKYIVNSNLKIKARSLFMLQRKAKEINFGVLTYYRINESDYILVSGVDVRWNDAVIFNIGLNHKNISYRLSYDYNTSSLNRISDGRGGTEISIIYTPSLAKSVPSIN